MKILRQLRKSDGNQSFIPNNETIDANKKYLVQIGIQIPYRAPVLNITEKIKEISLGENLNSLDLSEYEEGTVLKVKISEDPDGYNYYKVVFKETSLEKPSEESLLLSENKIELKESSSNCINNEIFYDSTSEKFKRVEITASDIIDKTFVPNDDNDNDIFKKYVQQPQTGEAEEGLYDSGEEFFYEGKISETINDPREKSKRISLTPFKQYEEGLVYDENETYHTIRYTDNENNLIVDNSIIQEGFSQGMSNDIDECEVMDYKVISTDDGKLFKKAFIKNSDSFDVLDDDVERTVYEKNDKSNKTYYKIIEKEIDFDKIESGSEVSFSGNNKTLFDGNNNDKTINSNNAYYFFETPGLKNPQVVLNYNNDGQPSCNLKYQEIHFNDDNLEKVYTDESKIPEGLHSDTPLPTVVTKIPNPGSENKPIAFGKANITTNKLRLGEDTTIDLSKDNRGPYYLMTTNSYTVDDSIKNALNNNPFTQDFFEYFNNENAYPEESKIEPLLDANVVVLDKKYDSNLVSTAKLEEAYTYSMNAIGPQACYWMTTDLRNTDYNKNKESYCVVSLAGNSVITDGEDGKQKDRDIIDFPSNKDTIESQDVKVFNVTNKTKDDLITELNRTTTKARIFLEPEDDYYTDIYKRKNSYYKAKVVKKTYADDDELDDNELGIYYTKETRDEFTQNTSMKFLDRIPVSGTKTNVYPLVRTIYQTGQAGNVLNDNFNIAERIDDIIDRLVIDGYLDISPNGVNSLQYSTLQDADPELQSIYKAHEQEIDWKEIDDNNTRSYFRDGDLNTKYKRWAIEVDKNGKKETKIVHVFWPSNKNNKYLVDNYTALGGNSSDVNYDVGKFKRLCLDELAKKGLFGNNDYICILGICTQEGIAYSTHIPSLGNNKSYIAKGQRIPAGGKTHLGVTGHFGTDNSELFTNNEINNDMHGNWSYNGDSNPSWNIGEKKSEINSDNYSTSKALSVWGNPWAAERETFKPFYKMAKVTGVDQEGNVHTITCFDINCEESSIDTNQLFYCYEFYCENWIADKDGYTIFKKTTPKYKFENGQIKRDTNKDKIETLKLKIDKKEYEQQFRQCHWWWTSGIQCSHTKVIPTDEVHYHDNEPIDHEHGVRERIFYANVNGTEEKKNTVYLRQLNGGYQSYNGVNDIESFYKLTINKKDLVNSALTQVTDLETISKLNNEADSTYKVQKVNTITEAFEKINDNVDYMYIKNEDIFAKVNNKQRYAFLPYSKALEADLHRQCELTAPNDVHLWYLFDKDDPLLRKVSESLYLSPTEFERYYKNCKIISKIPYYESLIPTYVGNKKSNNHEEIYGRILAAFKLENGNIKSDADSYYWVINTEADESGTTHYVDPYNKQYKDNDVFTLIADNDFVLIESNNKGEYDKYQITIESDDNSAIYRKVPNINGFPISNKPVVFKTYKDFKDSGLSTEQPFCYVYQDENNLRNGLYQRENGKKFSSLKSTGEKIVFKENKSEITPEKNPNIKYIWKEDNQYVIANGNDTEISEAISLNTDGIKVIANDNQNLSFIEIYNIIKNNKENGKNFYLIQNIGLYKLLPNEQTDNKKYVGNVNAQLYPIDNDDIIVSVEDMVITKTTYDQNNTPFINNGVPYCLEAVSNNIKYWILDETSIQTQTYTNGNSIFSKEDKYITEKEIDSITTTKTNMNENTLSSLVINYRDSINKYGTVKKSEVTENGLVRKDSEEYIRLYQPSNEMKTYELDPGTKWKFDYESNAIIKDDSSNNTISNINFYNPNSEEEVIYREYFEIIDDSENNIKYLVSFYPETKSGKPVREKLYYKNTSGLNGTYIAEDKYEITIGDKNYYITPRNVLEFEVSGEWISDKKISFNSSAWIPREALIDIGIYEISSDTNNTINEGDKPTKGFDTVSLQEQIIEEIW